MPDGGDGFAGRFEVVEPQRGNRRWPLDLQARIVAASFRPGVRVGDVAWRHGVVAHQLSGWRRQAREGLPSLPLGMAPALSVLREGPCQPAFGSVSVMPEPEPEVTQAPARSIPEAEVSIGIMTVALGSGVVVRVPGEVTVERAAALVRALQDKR